MSYSRRILHYSPGPADLVGAISDRVVEGAWFELSRHGGCGRGEVRLKDAFPDRSAIGLGDWVAFEYDTGDRWYLGRVERREATSPAGVTLHLAGPAVQLGEVFPGGFGSDVADGVPPHRFGFTDLFPDDPDRSDETIDLVSEPSQLLERLFELYVVPRTDVTLEPTLLDSSTASRIRSLKLRGQETVEAIVRDLANRAGNASWGVDEQRRFFFLQPRTTLLDTYREATDTVRLEEAVDRELLFNRVMLVGGYVYGPEAASGDHRRHLYRWEGNYVQPASRAVHGERRIRLRVPWVRGVEDSREFVREFFRVYAEPTTRFEVEVAERSTLPRPWLGRVRLEDRDGNELVTAQPESVRVGFDHVPRFTLSFGPPDPRRVWHEPPGDDHEIVPGDEASGHGGDVVTFASSGSSGGGGPDSGSSGPD